MASFRASLEERSLSGGSPRRSLASAGRRAMQDESALELDFSLEEMDPSLQDGHRVAYDREVPFELRVQDVDGLAMFDHGRPKEVGTLEAIRCKILALGDELNPKHCRFEVTSENDLFFHFTHSVDENNFRDMQEKQKLMIDFSDYVAVIIKMLNNCIKDTTHIGRAILPVGGAPKLPSGLRYATGWPGTLRLHPEYGASDSIGRDLNQRTVAEYPGLKDLFLYNPLIRL
eukprot:g32377.t1